MRIEGEYSESRHTTFGYKRVEHLNSSILHCGLRGLAHKDFSGSLRHDVMYSVGRVYPVPEQIGIWLLAFIFDKTFKLIRKFAKWSLKIKYEEIEFVRK